jgi:hypothetical protein
LPYPFFERSNLPTTVLLASHEPDILATAATAMAALGSRASTPPPQLIVGIVGERWDLGSRPLIVVGGPNGSEQSLRLRLADARTLSVPPPPRRGSSAGGDAGWLFYTYVPGQSHGLLWVSGYSEAGLLGAAEGVGRRDLQGQSVVVAPDGQSTVRQVSEIHPVTTIPLASWISAGLSLGAAVLVVMVVGLEVRRSWRIGR